MAVRRKIMCRFSEKSRIFPEKKRKKPLQTQFLPLFIFCSYSARRFARRRVTSAQR